MVRNGPVSETLPAAWSVSAFRASMTAWDMKTSVPCRLEKIVLVGRCQQQDAAKAMRSSLQVET